MSPAARYNKQSEPERRLIVDMPPRRARGRPHPPGRMLDLNPLTQPLAPFAAVHDIW